MKKSYLAMGAVGAIAIPGLVQAGEMQESGRIKGVRST